MKDLTISDLAKMAIVAALYVILTVTPPLNVISYGVYQFRIAEMLNFLAFYKHKYIVSLTIGCIIANFFSGNMVDVVVGSLSTLVFVSLGVWLFERYMKERILGGLFNKAFFYFALFFSFFMVTIAAELAIMLGAPFFLTWFTTAVGELASLLVGALIIDAIAKRIDLSK